MTTGIASAFSNATLKILFVVFHVVFPQKVPDPCNCTTTSSMSDTCDQGSSPRLQEGNLEEHEFPWLGVIRVHLYEGSQVRVALTGAALVRGRFALVVAADLAKIPLRIFKEDTRAMFIPRHGRPWHCRLRDYILHPDYQNTPFTIAVVELDYDEPLPVRSICWPDYAFNTSSDLYVTGYTDRRNILEKVVYKAQYIGQDVCDEFYIKTGLMDVIAGPRSYLCAYSERSRKRCLWDNGMLLISNSSAFWTLVGFGIQGPGCAAPARFINIIAYLPWVQSVTTSDRPNNNYGQQSAFGEGFYTKKAALREMSRDVPIHSYEPGKEDDQTGLYGKLSSLRLSETRSTGKGPIFGEYYQLDDRGRPVFVIDRIDDDTINIRTFDEMYEESPGNCVESNRLVYHEEAKINITDIHSASAVYRISLYDWLVSGYTCIRVKVDCSSRSKAYLWYKGYIHMKERGDSEETPDSVLIHYPIEDHVANAVSQLLTTAKPIWQPKKISALHPIYIEEKRGRVDVSNLNLYLNFTFKGSAVLRVEVYGPYKERRKLKKNNKKPYNPMIKN